MRQRILRGSAHLQVIEQAESGFDNADDVLAKARAIPGVAAVAPVLFSPAMIMNDALGSPRTRRSTASSPSFQTEVVDFRRGGRQRSAAGSHRG